MEIVRKSPKHILAMDNVKEAIVISWYSDWVVDDMLNEKITAHYHIDYEGLVTPLATDDSVLNHCPHSYKNWNNMNYVSLGIILEKRSGKFSKEQKKSIKILTRKLSKRYNIPKEKIFSIDQIDQEHKQITNLSRGYNTWEEYQCTLHHSAAMQDYADGLKESKVSWTQQEVNLREMFKSMRILNFDDDGIDPRIYTLLDRTMKYMKGLPLYE